jgi:hypothetical protein
MYLDLNNNPALTNPKNISDNNIISINYVHISI